MRPLVFIVAGALTSIACAHASPAPSESLEGRAAVRGAALVGAKESEELRALRAFETETFPRDGQAARAHGELEIPAWVTALKQPDLAIRYDEHVLNYLSFYKNDRKGRAIMASWLKRQTRYRAMFRAALEKAGLPLALEYVSMIESGFEPTTRSSAGAVGLWQFMPSGGRIYGLRIDYWVDERRSPERATAAVTRYFQDLKDRFGAWPLVLAAFNAGYGAVMKSTQRYNTNDYWELCRHENGLPWDTALYVPKVMATALVGENREAFGYGELASDAALSFERADAASSMSFESIARAAGVSASEIAALNPELRRGRTPPERWSVKLPMGAAARFSSNHLNHRENLSSVMVRRGERLEEIAARHGMNVKELRALNGVEDLSEISAGLNLLVVDGRAPVNSSKDAIVVVAVPDKEAVVRGRQRVFYRVAPHDQLNDIAESFSVSGAELARWNRIDPDARLVGGMVLQVWTKEAVDTSKVAVVDPKAVRLVTTGSPEFFEILETQRGRKRVVYTVQKGDDITKVARRFHLTVGDVERINRFSRATALKIGQRLTIYVPMTAAEKRTSAKMLVPGGTDVDAEETSAPSPSSSGLPKPPPVDGSL